MSCHQNDYNNAKVRSTTSRRKFPTTCELCHDTSKWSDGTFNHAQTGWALTGIAYGAAASLHRLPRQQQLQHHEHGLRELPPERLQQGQVAGGSHRGKVPDHLRDVP